MHVSNRSIEFFARCAFRNWRWLGHSRAQYTHLAGKVICEVFDFHVEVWTPNQSKPHCVAIGRSWLN